MPSFGFSGAVILVHKSEAGNINYISVKYNNVSV